jgi:hypothetical protein
MQTKITAMLIMAPERRLPLLEALESCGIDVLPVCERCRPNKAGPRCWKWRSWLGTNAGSGLPGRRPFVRRSVQDAASRTAALSERRDVRRAATRGVRARAAHMLRSCQLPTARGRLLDPANRPENREISLIISTREAEMSAATEGDRVGELVCDLDIEQWIHERYGFVPHPFWISHCKELFLLCGELSSETRRPWHECPPDKRLIIREAFAHFGMMEEHA